MNNKIAAYELYPKSFLSNFWSTVHFEVVFFAPFHLCETPVGKGLRIKREK